MSTLQNQLLSATSVPVKTFLTSKKVLNCYDISQMTLYRWTRDHRLNFPKPIWVNRRKYYDLAEIEAWERKRSASTGC